MVCLFLHGGSFENLKAAFHRLREGGNVTNPLKKTLFGIYGTLNDPVRRALDVPDRQPESMRAAG